MVHALTSIRTWCLTAAMIATAAQTLADQAKPRMLQTLTPAVSLDSPESSEQLLIFGTVDQSSNAGSQADQTDVTRQCEYVVADDHIVKVTAGGLVTPITDGNTSIHVRSGNASLQIPVSVSGVQSPGPVSFRDQVIPILSKAGCNSGGCHGKAEGQNGFKLSVFGYDAESDYDALVRDGRGRRVFPAAPEQSLLLTKATAQVPHGGGKKMDRDSRWHRLIKRWIAEGMPMDTQSMSPVISIRAQPAEVTLNEHGTQQLRVEAVRADGRTLSVTVEADFQSNNDVIAGVDSNGLIQASDIPGECAILVRYMGHVAVCRVIRPGRASSFQRPAENNFIDTLVWNKLEQLRVIPAAPASDAVFLRRVFLDTIGTLPTSEEARRFLEDTSSDKRKRLIADLLERPEYSDFWAQKWTDLLQVDKDIVTPRGAVAMTRWVHDQIRSNTPYDQFVRQILTARGSTLRESPAAFFQVQSDAEKAARAVSQLFLGVRIECAQCHHHPFERWDQKDYYAWAGLFTGIERKSGPAGSLRISSINGENLKHPRTAEPVPAAGLGAEPAPANNQTDRREAMAEWLTSRQNTWFTRTIVNRLVAHYLGRGLVEPIDDLRATNPASSEQLMQALVEHMQAVGYDQRAFTRTLLESAVYQLGTEPGEPGQSDEQNYSRALWKPIPAEVLLDAISQITGVPEEFNGWPIGYRAIQVWDNKLPSHFLEVFGRPSRQTVCACERGSEPSIAQALHLMNSETTTLKIQNRHGQVTQLTESAMSPTTVVEELYLSVYSRFPVPAERNLMEAAFTTSPSRREAIEDILWTLLNTREFVFNH